MLKFIKHHMTTIGGIEIFPIIGFVLFFTFFLVMLWYVLSMKREHVNELMQMPLTDNEPVNAVGTRTE